MLLLIWLAAWLASGTPSVHEWNNWLVALIICGVIDLVGGRKLV